MDYEKFINEINNYWNLYEKGLKKQANKFLFDFIEQFKNSISKKDIDTILFKFCKKYIDDIEYTNEKNLSRNLPFQIREILYCYLIQESKKDKMPHMRWFFQIFGTYCKDTKNEEESGYYILKKAYKHKQCDQTTVNLYFNEQLEMLWFGQHHFPEYCLITISEFNSIIKTVNKILSEKYVSPTLIQEFEYYKKLYDIYFSWIKDDKKSNFYDLCDVKGIKYDKITTIYYEK